jgi:hypothetical protein
MPSLDLPPRHFRLPVRVHELATGLEHGSGSLWLRPEKMPGLGQVVAERELGAAGSYPPTLRV